MDVTIHDVEDLSVRATSIENGEIPRFTALKLRTGKSGVRFYFDHTPEDAQAAQRFIDGLHETLSQIMATLEEKEPELVIRGEVAA
jgi:hypothetical protein